MTRNPITFIINYAMGEKTISIQCPKCFTYNSPGTLYCNKCGSPLDISRGTISYPTPGKPPPDEGIQFKPGDIFARRYRIIEEIGRGGMGKVYKAEDTELNITVALKIILPKYASLPSFIEHFKRETLAARSISHENVIRIHDIGEADNIKYISMDYIKGQNLRELIRASGSLTIETTVNMVREMGEALKAAHRKGIVHYDLKPSNIMVDSSGRVYIMDFGLAKAIQAEQAADKARSIAGTPQYMSPEQARGEKTDHRSDIYSLGVIIFEMLTGRLPFEASTAAEYREKHIKEPPPLPSKINPLIPLSVEAAILKCLEKDREKRYQDVEEISRDLKKKPLKPQVRGLSSWIRKPGIAAMAGILVLVVVLIIFLWKKPPPSASIAPKAGRISMAIMFLTNNTGDKSLDYMSRAFTDLLITDLLQSRYIRVLTVDKLYEILRELKLHEATSYSSEDLKRVASLGSVDHVLHGDYTRAGDTYRINAFVYDAKSMELLGSEKVTGAGPEIFTMVDELTRKVKGIFNLSPKAIASDIDKDLRKISTDNEEAFRYYTDAVKLADELKFEESNRALEKAVGLDPEFALAYRKLSENFVYLGDVEQENIYLQKALSLLNRVSERDYYLIQGFAADRIEVQVDNYKKLLSLYPDDVEANILLGALYRNIEEWDLAQERAEKVLEIESRSSMAYEILSETYRAKGLYDKARTIIEEHQSVFSNLVNYHMQIAQTFLCQGQYDLALAEVERASAIEPGNFLNIELKGNICQVKGDLDSARKAYEALFNKGDNLSKFLGLSWMIRLYLMQGEFKRCREELARGIEFSQKLDIKIGVVSLLIMSVYVELELGLFPEALESSNRAVEVALEIGYIEYKIHALDIRGLAYLKNKRLSDAKSIAEQLKQVIESSGFKKSMCYYYHLMGMIAREEGRMREAIDDFEVAFSLLPKEHYKFDEHAFYLDSLASTLYQRGELDRAQLEYEKIISLTTGRLGRGDIFSRSFYWLGKILQTKGLKEKAIEFYGKFLDLWKNADKGLAEIADARMQLAALKKEAARK